MSVYAWGYNRFGQCNAKASSINKKKRKCTDDMKSENATIQCYASWAGTILVDTDGYMQSYGSSVYRGLNRIDIRIKEIACGRSHILLVDLSSNVYGLGWNRYGQLGLSICSDECISEPILLKSFSNSNKDDHIISVAAGETHSLALSSSGHVFSFGKNEHGLLGIESEEEMISTPSRIQSGFESVLIKEIKCSWYYSIAVSTNGAVYTWGLGLYGTLGHGDTRTVYIPKRITSLRGVFAKSVSCGLSHAVMTTIHGALFSWGSKYIGRIYDNNAFIPDLVDLTPDITCVSSISCGSKHTLVLSTDGEVFGWGCNDQGQISPESKDDYISLPMKLSHIQHGLVNNITAGGWHSIIVYDCLKK